MSTRTMKGVVLGVFSEKTAKTRLLVVRIGLKPGMRPDGFLYMSPPRGRPNTRRKSNAVECGQTQKWQPGGPGRLATAALFPKPLLKRADFHFPSTCRRAWA